METSSQVVAENAPTNAKTNLPDEIVTGIISRLPVKPVFQLQCLSKNFSFITKDLHFVDAHLKQSTFLRPAIIFNGWNRIYLIRCSSRLDTEFTVEEVPLHHNISFSNSPSKMIEIVGSCNGLVLVVVGEKAIPCATKVGNCFIWNPATLQCDLLPSPNHVPHMHILRVFWGFGYCTKSKGYKIVRVMYYRYVEPSPYDDSENYSLAEVFSFESDRSWRRIDFSKVDILCNEHGITVKGVVYWQPMHDRSRLLAFDLAKDEFSYVTCPVQTYSNIMEFKGSLALCSKSETSVNSFDVWVLKDKEHFASDGDECSWEKCFTTAEFPPSIEPIQFLNDRQLFLLFRKSTHEYYCFMYELDSKEIRQIPGVKLLSCFSIEVYKFVDSLVSLSVPQDNSIYHSSDVSK